MPTDTIQVAADRVADRTGNVLVVADNIRDLQDVMAKFTGTINKFITKSSLTDLVNKYCEGTSIEGRTHNYQFLREAACGEDAYVHSDLKYNAFVIKNHQDFTDFQKKCDTTKLDVNNYGNFLVGVVTGDYALTVVKKIAPSITSALYFTKNESFIRKSHAAIFTDVSGWWPVFCAPYAKAGYSAGNITCYEKHVFNYSGEWETNRTHWMIPF